MTESTLTEITSKAQGSSLATASLVLAIISLPLTILCFTGVLTAILAISLGHVALHKARHASNRLAIKNKAIMGLVISYLYITFAIILVTTIIVNRVSKTQFSDDTGMNFTIHTPLKGTSYEWQVKHNTPLVALMAPKNVRISAQLDVAIPFKPQNPRDFQYLSINLIPKKYNENITDVARKFTSGVRVYDKSYCTSDPELISISGIPSVLFRESIIINGSQAEGIAFLVPCTRGYYLLTFRCDPNTYNESFYKRIANTFKPKDE